MSDNTASSCDTVEFCPICKSVAKQRCASCLSVYYCSKEHQRLDWKVHSKNCRLVKLVESSTLGAHNVATRNIKPDEVVISEKSLLITPSLITGPSCLNCYTTLLDHDSVCKKCGWPLCQNCKKHGSECKITIKNRKSRVNVEDYSTPALFHATITVLRALAMKDENPNNYRKLLSLPDKRKGIKNDWSTMPIEDMACVIMECMELDDVEESEIVKIIGIARVNSFALATLNSGVYNIIYYKVPYNLQNCRPNCAFILSDRDESRVVIQAISTIQKGDPITISFISTVQGAVKRRNDLKYLEMQCMCERCKDPTEFGTMFNALRCVGKNCNGYLLPPVFLVSNDKEIPDYVCDKCKYKMPYKEIDEIEKIAVLDYVFTASVMFNRLEELKHLIIRQCHVLHENHIVVFNTKIEFIHTCCKYLETNPSTQDTKVFDFLNYNLKLCKEITSLMEILLPAYTLVRGLTLMSMVLTKMQISSLWQNQGDTEMLLKENIDHLNKAYRLLRHESKDSHGGRLAYAVIRHRAILNHHLEVYKKAH